MQVVSSLDPMKTLPAVAKAGIVVGSYVAAILLAFCVVSIYINRVDGLDGWRTSSNVTLKLN